MNRSGRVQEGRPPGQNGSPVGSAEAQMFFGSGELFSLSLGLRAQQRAKHMESPGNIY